MNDDLILRFTTFDGSYDSRVLPHNRKEMEWAELKQLLSEPHKANAKDEVAMISGATFAMENETGWQPAQCKEANEPNPNHPEGLWVGRNRQSVRQYSMLLLDYDDGTHPNWLNNIGDYEWAWYTSWSHSEERFKFRAIFPLAQPVSARYISERKQRLLSIFKCDSSTFDLSRAFYLPATSPANASTFQCGSKQGKLLDLSDLPVDLHQVQQEVEANYANTPATARDIIGMAEMLKHIPPDLEYRDWYRIALALMSTADEGNIDTLKTLWHTWSSGDPRYDEKQTENLWCYIQRNYDPNHPDGVSKGTLIALAKKHGWQPQGKPIDFD